MIENTLALLFGLLVLASIGVFSYKSVQNRSKEQIEVCAKLNGKILKVNSQQFCLDTEKDVLLVMP